MAEYRCYLFDRESQIAGIEVEDCASDLVAQAWADQLFRRAAHAWAIELWTETRLVERRVRPQHRL
jgi:hypothetical protein